MAGSRVVPIFYDLPTDEIIALTEAVDGILFTGGGADITNSTSLYKKAGHTILSTALLSEIPLWGEV